MPRRPRTSATRSVDEGLAATTTVHLTTSDAVPIVAAHWDVGTRDIGCVVAHGFTGSFRNPNIVRICSGLAGAGLGVLAPDLRGHGASGGLGTAGADEIHEIAAAVAWMRASGYRHVAVLGWSMGGSAVLRHAGLGGDADAVVSISAPGHWFERGTRSMRLVHWMFESRTGRVATRALRGTRLSSDGWATVPEAPADVAGSITVPLLLVHGDADHYFPLRHVEALAAAAPRADVWIERGMGHAEVATSAGLVERVAEWVRARCGATPPVWNDGTRD